MPSRAEASRVGPRDINGKESGRDFRERGSFEDRGVRCSFRSNCQLLRLQRFAFSRETSPQMMTPAEFASGDARTRFLEKRGELQFAISVGTQPSTTCRRDTRCLPRPGGAFSEHGEASGDIVSVCAP